MALRRGQTIGDQRRRAPGASRHDPAVVARARDGTISNGEVEVHRDAGDPVHALLEDLVGLHDEAGQVVGADEGSGNLPERFIWQGHTSTGMAGDGTYEVVLQAWDKAGNTAKATHKVALSRSSPEVGLAVARKGREMVVDLEHAGKVPLAYWRMEMWTKEGKILTEAEGQELPAKIGIELPDADREPEVEGYLVVQDILGNRARRKVQDLLPKVDPKTGGEEKEKKPAGVSESWVDEF